MAWTYWHNDVLPLAAMVVVECTNVGLAILFKAASLKGMSYHVFIVYSFAISTLVLLLPLPFIFNSTPVLPLFRFSIISRICLLSLIGFIAVIFGNLGLTYSSPTLASAMNNLTPAFTFILAVIFRMERVAIRSSSTQAKIIGTLVSISGALVVALCKGPAVLSASSTVPSISLQQSLGSSSKSNWVIGSLLLATQCLLYSIWYIILAQVMKIYPEVLIVSFLCNLISTIISAPVCFIAEANTSAWKLGSEVALVAVIYSGSFVSWISPSIHTWALHLKGPVYVAMFRPLSIAIAAIMSFIFLGDPLHLGSVIGAIIISIGFYAAIWGKAKEGDQATEEYDFSSSVSSSDGKTPLLQSHKIEDM